MSRRSARRTEVLLKLRKRSENAAMQQFSRAVDDAETIAHRLVLLRRALRMHSDALREMLPVGADAMNLCLYRQCVTDIRQAIAEKTNRLETIRCSLPQRKTDLFDAMKQRKAMGALKDRQLARRAADERRLDVRQWDEAHAAHVAAGKSTGHRPTT